MKADGITSRLLQQLPTTALAWLVSLIASLKAFDIMLNLEIYCKGPYHNSFIIDPKALVLFG